MKGKRFSRYLQGTLGLLLFLALWHFASTTGLFGKIDPEYALLLLPTPETVGMAIVETVKDGTLWGNVSVSIVRVALGFALAVLVGIPLGLGMALSPLCNNLAEPFVRLFSPIPGIAWVPLAILWFGLGDQAAIFIITIGSIFPIVISTVQGVRDVNAQLVDAARMMGASRLQVIGRVMLPSVIPYLVTGFRLGLGFAWRVVIAAEMVGVPRGIGYMLGVGRSTGRTDITIVTMVTLGVLMLVVEEVLFAPLERRTRFWRRSLAV